MKTGKATILEGLNLNRDYNNPEYCVVHPNGANSNKASTYTFYVNTNAEVSNVTERCCQGSINHIKKSGYPQGARKETGDLGTPRFVFEKEQREGGSKRGGRERQRERNPEGQRGRKAKKDKREKDKEPWLARQN